MVLTCLHCKKQFERRYKQKYCSIKCAWIVRTSRRDRVNGNINDQGYREIYVPNHPHNRKGWILEHRVIMEKKLGRYLKSHEYVHHINEKRDDNRKNNLQLVDMATHKRIHAERKVGFNDLVLEGILLNEHKEEVSQRSLFNIDEKVHINPKEFIKSVIKIENLYTIFNKDQEISFEEYARIRLSVINSFCYFFCLIYV